MAPIKTQPPTNESHGHGIAPIGTVGRQMESSTFFYATAPIGTVKRRLISVGIQWNFSEVLSEDYFKPG